MTISISNDVSINKHDLKNALISSLPNLLRVKKRGFLQNLLFIYLYHIVSFSSLHAQNPNWTAPNGSSYSGNASVVGKVHINGSVSNNVNDRIALFMGTQIRGLSTPLQIGGNVIHFITVYSNQSSEAMQAKIYHFNTNTVYDVAAPFAYVSNGVFGDIDVPLIFNGYNNNNAPLNINAIPAQQTIQGLVFPQINLNSYLVQPDPYPVVWTYTPNSNLSVSIVNGTLNVGAIPTFSGSTQLTLRATEQSPFPQQFAEVVITYNVTPAYSSPAWNPIPNQGIVTGASFASVNLNTHEYQYAGLYLEFDYKPIIVPSVPPTSPPTWVQPTNFPNTMTITAKANYTPKHQFQNAGDKLAAFVGTQLRGVASLNTSTGLFFLTIGGNAAGETVTLKLYSAAMQKTLPYNGTYAFLPSQIIGNPSSPAILDFTPILPSINPTSSITNFSIVDPTFIGEVGFEFNTYDSLYPAFLNDQTITKLCIVANTNDLDTFYRDADGDGLGNPALFIQACSTGDGYVANDDDCDDNSGVDPTVTFSMTENSGIDINDGNLCSGGSANLYVAGGIGYIWSTGATTNSIAVLPTSTTLYKVTVTLSGGICFNVIPFYIYVETNLVKNKSNQGNGSLRNVLFCATEGSSVTYDFPTVTNTILTAPLTISKNINVSGLANQKPRIDIDFNSSTSGITINSGKTLTLNNVDIKLLFPQNKKSFIGPGSVSILASSKVTQL